MSSTRLLMKKNKKKPCPNSLRTFYALIQSCDLCIKDIMFLFMVLCVCVWAVMVQEKFCRSFKCFLTPENKPITLYTPAHSPVTITIITIIAATATTHKITCHSVYSKLNKPILKNSSNQMQRPIMI